MSFFNALDDQKKQVGQGWTYSNSYNRNSSAFNEWPVTSALLGGTTSVSGENFVHEVKSSDTDDEVMLVDDPGLVVGREEVIASDRSPMAGSGYQGSYAHNTYIQNQHNHIQNMLSTYNHVEQNHGTMQMSAQQGFSPHSQRDNHVPTQRCMQLPLCVHETYNHPGQKQSHSVQQSHGPQLNSQSQGQHQSVSQQQQRHSVGQNTLGQQNMVQADQRLHQQQTTSQVQGRLRQMLNGPPVTSPAFHQHMGNGNQQSFKNHQPMARQQDPHLTSHGTPQSQSHGQDAKYAAQQHGQGISVDQQSLRQQQQQQQQQHVYNQQQQQHRQQQQQQLSAPQLQRQFSANSGGSHYVHVLSQEYDAENQFRQQSQSEHNVQHSPQNSPQVSLQNSALSSLQNSPHISLQNSPHISLQGSPMVTLQNSPHLSLQSSPHVSLQNSPQVSVQSSPQLLPNSPQVLLLHSPQLSAQNSPQLSLSNSPQVLQLQSGTQVLHSSAQLLPNSFHVAVLNSPPVSSHNSTQSLSQVAHQGETNQKGGNQLHEQKSTLITDLQGLIPSSKVVFDNNKRIQGLQENTYYSVQHSGVKSTVFYNGKDIVLSQQQETEPKTGNTDMGKGRGQPKQRANRGGRGGHGGRGRGCENAADNMTGLHMAPNHFKPEPTFESCDSSAAESMQDQEQGYQETVVPMQQESLSPPQGTELCGINIHSPSTVTSVAVPRLSATNEVWPTPMPSMKKEGSESPPALMIDSFSSCSQQSSDSPDSHLSPGPGQEETKSSPSVVPAQNVPPQAPASPTPEQKRQEQRRKHNLADDEEGTALCNYCGYSSSNFEVCEGCKRKLPVDVKVVVKKRKIEPPESANERERTCGGGKVNAVPATTGPSMDKKTFYGSKLQSQGAAFTSKMEEFSNEFAVKNTGRVFPRRRGNGRRTGGRGRKSRESREPVTVTISSDEDEGPDGDESRRLSVGSSQGATLTSQDDEDGGFFLPPVSKPSSSFGTSRRHRMQDATGRCIQKAATPPPITNVGDGIFFKVRGVRVGTMRTSGVEVRFMTRSIHFKVVSDRTQEELDFFVYVTELTWIKFTLNQSQPVAFIKVTPGGGLRLRSHLKIKDSGPEYFDPGSQDPQKNMIVVIIDLVTSDKELRDMLLQYSKVQREFPDFIQEISYDAANDMLVKSTPPVLTSCHGDRAIKGFTQYGNAGSYTPASSSVSLGSQGDSVGAGGGSGVQEPVSIPFPMTGDAGDESPGPCNSQEDRASRSPSPKIGFVGPIEKLLTYPLIPTKGAITITNEDLYCLNEGEFLNDVILDFYLKYLFREKLSEEDRQRTHIFSSFFYKRLTQRQSRSLQEPEEAGLSLPQKRHSRVKTWTRHVDIFSKDFLLIPINEHSHWFLAVICFPGKASQEYISFQPATSSCEEEVGQSRDAESSQQSEAQSPASAEDQNSDSLPDIVPSTTSKGEHVLGKVISPEIAMKGKTSFSLGLRQACILIMDSLMGPSRNNVIRILKEYLQVEWDLKKGTPRNMIKTVRGCCPKVPQQTNFSDCGVFVLQYAEAFFENPIASFSIPMKVEHWFPLSKVEKKRESIRDLILRLQAEGSR